MPIEKRTGESKDEFISRCIGIEIKDGRPQDQAAAICYTKAEEYFSATASYNEPAANIELESFNDYPESASNNAKRALEIRDEVGIDCGTPVGWQRANQLAKKENISADTIGRMAAFARHEQNSAGNPKEDCGALMWLAWGGDSGINWAKSKIETVRKQELSIGDNISFDYDGVLSTARGKEWLKREIDSGSKVYIISARSSDSELLNIADEFDIPQYRVFATGSNKAKVEKVKSLNIKKHYDDNPDVVKQLGSVGKEFKRSVLFRADQEIDQKYLDGSFSIYFKSDTSLYNSKNKAHQKAKEYGFPDNVVYGNFSADVDMTDDDPFLSKLISIGKPKDESKYIKSGKLNEPINFSNLDEFEKEFVKDVDLKFIRIETVFTYEKRPDAADLKTTSRPFCKSILASNKEWKLSEIRDLVNDPDFRSLYDLSKYPQFADPVQFTGGWYTNPETGDTTPFCRHQWVPKTKIIR